ncbi:MAG: hypothetical protein ACSLFE_07595, partial [Gemmatimonadaceae bacterium]
ASPRGSHLIAGGAAFGVAPEALFTELGVDYAVAGDGERASVALVAALAAGEEPTAIPGLVRRGAGAITFTPPGEDADLDSLPPPALARWVDLRRYQRHGATVPVQYTQRYTQPRFVCTGTVAPCR